MRPCPAWSRRSTSSRRSAPLCSASAPRSPPSGLCLFRHHDTAKQVCVAEQALLWYGCDTGNPCCEGRMIMRQPSSASLCVSTCTPEHPAHMAYRTSPAVPASPSVLTRTESMRAGQLRRGTLLRVQAGGGVTCRRAVSAALRGASVPGRRPAPQAFQVWHHFGSGHLENLIYI